MRLFLSIWSFSGMIDLKGKRAAQVLCPFGIFLVEE